MAPSNSAKDQTYIWDPWNRLVEVKEGITTLASFEYDGLHRRIRKSVGSNHYHYYYNEENQLLEEQLQVGAGTPAVRNEFVWHPQYIDALAARLDMTGGGNGVYYHTLYDANFNTTAIIDGTGTVQERYHYTPYGQTTFLDSAFSTPSATSTKNQENLYTSRQFDPETGLYYYRARYYHQTIGRFIARDPIGYRGGINLYMYVGNSPLIKSDPSGFGCLVKYSCTLKHRKDVGEPKTGEDCFYECRDIDRKSTGGASGDGEIIDCSVFENVPEGDLVRWTSKRAKNTKWFGEPCWECKQDYTEDQHFVIKGTLAFKSNCKKSECRLMCDDRADLIDSVCGSLPNEAAEIVCTAAAKAGGAVCREFCDAACKQE